MGKKRYLVTGGAGFVGHHIVDYLLRKTDHDVVLLDRMRFAGNMNRLADLRSVWDAGQRVSWVWHDLRAPISDMLARQLGRVDVIMHLAASSHVDRSIEDPAGCVIDNTLGTVHLLDFARRVEGLDAFLYFSTDEVFGPAPVGIEYSEWDRYRSGNPYAASKAGAEELCLSFHNTYKLPVIITHCMNIFGERQHPEKYIPMTIRKILAGEPVIVHSGPDKQTPGSRFYIHAQNVAAATCWLIHAATAGEKYNIVGEREVDNLSLAQTIATIVGRDLEYEMVDYHSSRPGHDLRYALSGDRLTRMGWTHPAAFERSLSNVVSWYMANPSWLG